MDVEVLSYATNEQDLGLTAKGYVFAVKALCQRRSKSHNSRKRTYEDRKRKLVDELKTGKGKGK